MLERIERVQGVGLFHDARAGARHKHERLSLVFAGNGRGKSTLANILASCGTGDSSGILDRETIDGTMLQEVALQFRNGHHVLYKAGAWTELRPELDVFDENFVERNVHSGSEVTPQQRKNLLDFALGDSAVAAREKERAATERQAEASARIRELSSRLGGHAGAMSLPVFRALPPMEDVANRISDAESRLRALEHIEAITARPRFTALDHPTLDIGSIFSLLARSIEDVQDDAERIVDERLRNADGGYREWLREGQTYDDHAECPYCGQSTAANDLVRAFRLHFSQGFRDLQSQVQRAARMVEEATAEQVIDAMRHHAHESRERVAAWMPEVALAAAEIADDGELASSTLGNLRELLLGLLARKSAAPADAIDASLDRIEAERLWEQFTRLISERNEIVRANNETIADYTRGLGAENAQRLRSDLERLAATHMRLFGHWVGVTR